MKQTKHKNKQTNIQGWRRLQRITNGEIPNFLVHFRFEFHELQLNSLTVRIVFFL